MQYSQVFQSDFKRKTAILKNQESRLSDSIGEGWKVSEAVDQHHEVFGREVIPPALMLKRNGLAFLFLAAFLYHAIALIAIYLLKTLSIDEHQRCSSHSSDYKLSRRAGCWRWWHLLHSPRASGE
jgi:hypothetical protein